LRLARRRGTKGYHRRTMGRSIRGRWALRLGPLGMGALAPVSSLARLASAMPRPMAEEHPVCYHACRPVRVVPFPALCGLGRDEPPSPSSA